MNNHSEINNDVNGAGTSYEGLTFGRRSDEAAQTVIMRNPRQPEKSRTTWTKALNKIVMRCIFESNPNVRGYRQRMNKIWKEEGLFELSEQKLAGQARVIRTNGWLSEVELEEIRREIETESNIQDGDLNREVTEQSTRHEDNGDPMTRAEDSERVDAVENVEERMKADGLGADDIRVLRMLQEELLNNEIEDPINLRFCDRRKLKEVTAQVDRVIPYLESSNLLQCNKIMKATG